MKLRLCIAMICVLLSHGAMAQNTPPRKGGNEKKYKLPPYGMAGCGLGSVLLGGKSEKSDVASNFFAVSTNQIYSNQLIALSSGTSNCNESGWEQEEAFRRERETYVSVNLGNLSREASQGEGEILRGLSEMIGCSGEDEIEIFTAVAQTEFSDIFSDTVPANIAGRFVTKAKQTDALQHCVRVR